MGGKAKKLGGKGGGRPLQKIPWRRKRERERRRVTRVKIGTRPQESEALFGRGKVKFT